ncbi:MAG: 50S ribosomal protein L29 [Desulfobacteria bacterium]
MKAADIRTLTVKETESKLKDFTVELFNLRFQHATGQLENPMKIPQLKKDIARIKTVLNEKIDK